MSYREKILPALRFFWLTALGYLFLYTAWLVWGSTESTNRTIVGALAVLFPVMSAACLSWMSFSRQENVGIKNSLIWFAVALTLQTCAHITRAILLMTYQLPAELITLLVEMIHLTAVLAFGIAIIRYPRTPRTGVSRLRLFIDTALAATAGLTLIWLTLLQSGRTFSEVSPLTQVSPLADLTLILVLLSLFLISDVSRPSAIMIWMTVGVALVSLSDMAVIPSMAAGVYIPGSPSEIGWTAGSLSLLAAIVSTYETSPAKIPLWLPRGVQRFQTLLPLVLVVILGWYALLDWRLSGVVNPLALWVTLILGLGLIARQGILAGEVEIRRAAEAQLVLETMNARLEELVAEKTASLSLAYEQLEEQNRSLQQLDRLKTDFVSLVSHELRAPLTNISAGIELLLAQRKTIPPDDIETLALVQIEIQRLTRFVETILDISALDAGRLPLYPAPLPFRMVISNLRVQFSYLPKADQIVWMISDDLPDLLVDEQALSSVMFHLLDNAIKYASSGPIEVSAVPVDAQVCVTVEDNGPGLAPDSIPFLFDQFYRAQSEDSRSTYGHGLGLYIVKRLVEAMQGRVAAKNRPQGGACFTLWLPIAGEEKED
jgi:signal transduction histidine kinase